MDLSLTGKHALVGGASRGIGRAAATALAQLGATVTGLARDGEALADMVESLDDGAGQKHGFFAVDFNDPAALGNALEAHVNQNPVHILVNNTGGPPEGLAHRAAPEEYLRAFNQHVICAQTLLQVVLPGMRHSGYGRVINVISTSVKQPIPGLGVSNTIRGAVANWAKTLADELGADGITVNNVLPGFTETERLWDLIGNRAAQSGESVSEISQKMRQRVPLRRFAAASETAAAIAFLASPEAAYINGINLPVDGGRTLSL